MAAVGGITIHLFAEKFSKMAPVVSAYLFLNILLQGESPETDVFEMDVTDQVEEVEAWVGGN